MADGRSQAGGPCEETAVSWARKFFWMLAVIGALFLAASLLPIEALG